MGRFAGWTCTRLLKWRRSDLFSWTNANLCDCCTLGEAELGWTCASFQSLSGQTETRWARGRLGLRASEVVITGEGVGVAKQGKRGKEVIMHPPGNVWEQMKERRKKTVVTECETLPSIRFPNPISTGSCESQCFLIQGWSGWWDKLWMTWIMWQRLPGVWGNNQVINEITEDRKDRPVMLFKMFNNSGLHRNRVALQIIKR